MSDKEERGLSGVIKYNIMAESCFRFNQNDTADNPAFWLLLPTLLSGTPIFLFAAEFSAFELHLESLSWLQTVQRG